MLHVSQVGETVLWILTFLQKELENVDVFEKQVQKRFAAREKSEHELQCCLIIDVLDVEFVLSELLKSAPSNETVRKICVVLSTLDGAIVVNLEHMVVHVQLFASMFWLEDGLLLFVRLRLSDESLNDVFDMQGSAIKKEVAATFFINVEVDCLVEIYLRQSLLNIQKLDHSIPADDLQCLVIHPLDAHDPLRRIIIQWQKVLWNAHFQERNYLLWRQFSHIILAIHKVNIYEVLEVRTHMVEEMFSAKVFVQVLEPLDLHPLDLSHAIFISNLLNLIKLDDVMIQPLNHLIAPLVKVDQLLAVVLWVDELKQHRDAVLAIDLN
jgi:hypothetical protein